MEETGFFLFFPGITNKGMMRFEAEMEVSLTKLRIEIDLRLRRGRTGMNIGEFLTIE
jgi:hypothetical protein